MRIKRFLKLILKDSSKKVNDIFAICLALSFGIISIVLLTTFDILAYILSTLTVVGLVWAIIYEIIKMIKYLIRTWKVSK